MTKLLPSVDGAGMVETMQAFMAQVPWAVTESSLNIVGSHDTGRIMWRVGGDRGRVEAALGMAYTMPGVPMLYYGDEIGLEGNTGEYGRRPFPWQAPDTWDQDLLGSVIELGRLREELTPIHDGGLRWVHAGPNAVAYVRESADGGVLALASRDACDPVDIPVSLLPGSERGNLVFGLWSKQLKTSLKWSLPMMRFSKLIGCLKLNVIQALENSPFFASITTCNMSSLQRLHRRKAFSRKARSC